MCQMFKFDIKECNKIRKRYENEHISTIQIAKEYGVTGPTIAKAIRRAGGKSKTPKECHRKFNSKECHKIRDQYDSGITVSALSKVYDCSDTPIRNALHYAGGKCRPSGYAHRKFFRNPAKERYFSCNYQLKAVDMDWLYLRQKGLCLWCIAPLPKDIFDCIVDHIGGKEGNSDRSKVRGLCCPNNVCNQLAGRVENNSIKREWGNLGEFVKAVKKTLKLNTGNLNFPRELS